MYNVTELSKNFKVISETPQLTIYHIFISQVHQKAAQLVQGFLFCFFFFTLIKSRKMAFVSDYHFQYQHRCNVVCFNSEDLSFLTGNNCFVKNSKCW